MPGDYDLIYVSRVKAGGNDFTFSGVPRRRIRSTLRQGVTSGITSAVPRSFSTGQRIGGLVKCLPCRPGKGGFS